MKNSVVVESPTNSISFDGDIISPRDDLHCELKVIKQI